MGYEATVVLLPIALEASFAVVFHKLTMCDVQRDARTVPVLALYPLSLFGRQNTLELRLFSFAGHDFKLVPPILRIVGERVAV